MPNRSIQTSNDRRRRLRGAATAAAGLAVVGLLTSCNLSSSNSKAGDVKAGSLAKGADLKDAKLTVGGKEFTEELILCQITSQALASAGANVTEKCGLNGSNTVRNALTSGSVDMYWEYTGTAWIGYLKHTEPIPGPAKQYQAVKKEDAAKNNIDWLNPAPYNNTYAIMANGDIAAKYHLKTLSDYAKLAKSHPDVATTCGASEFLSRSDGWPGVKKAYGISIPDDKVAKIQEGAIYAAVGKGKPCNFGEGTTTDQRVQTLHLVALQDDKHFFPIYNPAVTVRASVLEKYPQLAKVLNPIAAALDLSTIQQLNGEVDVHNKDPKDVAHAWLKSKGFVG